MNTLQSSARATMLWLVPVAVLAVLFLWQTDWGRAFARTPSAEPAAAPPPLTVALLPEYQPAGAGSDMVERTPFNPTRRPAPTPREEAAKPVFPRGKFTLSGTLVVDGKATAYLREVNGGKQRRVVQGESVDGLVVAEIMPDRVRLALGGESEELVMKLATGPRTTIQPVAPAPVTASAAPPGARQVQPAQPGAAPPQARDVAEILAERRRAARAAERAARNLPPGAPNPDLVPKGPVTAPNMPPVPQGSMNTDDPAWQQLYRRYQTQRR
ncbi:MAG: hypothetical protein IT518_07565 [Burkholderiales bacterium]|nr:hypothetical protein [Burkholderiales bacterium]